MNFFTLVFSIFGASFGASAVHASAPVSNGHDLLCSGRATASPHFFSCETPAGPSDHCSTEETNIDFSMNPVRGDLSAGLSGPLKVVSLDQIVSKNPNMTNEKMLRDLVHSTTGFIIYQDKVAVLQLVTPIGKNEFMTAVDFSAGTRMRSVYLALKDTDKFGIKFVPELNAEVGITIYCRAGTN